MSVSWFSITKHTLKEELEVCATIARAMAFAGERIQVKKTRKNNNLCMLIDPLGRTRGFCAITPNW